MSSGSWNFYEAVNNWFHLSNDRALLSRENQHDSESLGGLELTK
jgi:hypothetical protein